MKKMIIALLLLMLPMAFAINETDETSITITSDTISGNTTTSPTVTTPTNVSGGEIESMNTPAGAKVRLLQLEKSIAQNINRGEAILATITANNSSANVSGMQDTLDKMEILLLEVKNTSLNGTNAELAAQFVALKSQAIKLSKEFRDQAHVFVKIEDRERIKERIEKSDDNRTKALAAQIAVARKSYNAELLNETLIKLGINNSDLPQRVQNGTISVKEIKIVLKDAWKELSVEDKKEAALEIREDRVKKSVFRQAVTEKAEIRIEEQEEKLRIRWEENKMRIDIREDNRSPERRGRGSDDGILDDRRNDSLDDLFDDRDDDNNDSDDRGRNRRGSDDTISDRIEDDD